MNQAEIEARLHHLDGTLLGVQTLLISVMAALPNRAALAAHFREESSIALLHHMQDPSASAQTLPYFKRWCETTLDLLESPEML